MTFETFKQRLLDNEVAFTNDLKEAIWLLPDGSLIDGVWDCGQRSEDHRILELGTDLGRYDGDRFWNQLHHDFQCVRLVPETQYALIGVEQELTPIQQQLLKKTRYQIEKY